MPVLARFYGLIMNNGAFFDMRQLRQGLILFRIFIQLRKTFKQYFISGCPQLVYAAGDADGHVLRFHGFHLAGQETVPNESVQPQLVPRQERRS